MWTVFSTNPHAHGVELGRSSSLPSPPPWCPWWVVEAGGDAPIGGRMAVTRQPGAPRWPGRGVLGGPGRGGGEVTSADVLDILTPLWHTKGPTARFVHMRVRAVLEWAIAMEWRTDNPCDRLLHLLGPQHDVVRHHQALPHGEVAAAVEKLRAADPGKVDTLAFEFLVLTAARGGEVRGAVWSEIDRVQAVWTIPGSRMKTGRQHRVPLCESRA